MKMFKIVMEISAVLILISFDDHHTVISADTTLYLDPLSWNDANAYCTSKWQTLVAIRRHAKQRYLQEAILEKDLGLKELWIGLHVPDPNEPTKYKWSSFCSWPPTYSNWSPSLKSGPKDLCAFVKVESGSMFWFLDACDRKAARPFICESYIAVICHPRSDIFYDTEGEKTVPTGNNGEINVKEPATEQECKDDCDQENNCWGFVFTHSIPTKCVLYAEIDDPFYMENNKVDSSSETLYMKRCIFELNVDTNVLSVPSYDDCGSGAVSRCVSCVAAVEETTTQKHTTTFKISSAEKTTATSALTTETHMTPIVEVTSSDLHTTKSKSETTSTQKSIYKTTENHVTSPLEVTSSHVQTSTSQTETTSETDILSTEQKEVTTKNTGKTPYCVCTCHNVTKQISLEESINEIVNEIKIDRLKTSSYTRKHTSAWDSRKSSANIGYVGIAILISIAGLLVCLDSVSLIHRVFAMIRKLGTSQNENGN